MKKTWQPTLLFVLLIFASFALSILSIWMREISLGIWIYDALLVLVFVLDFFISRSFVPSLELSSPHLVKVDSHFDVGIRVKSEPKKSFECTFDLGPTISPVRAKVVKSNQTISFRLLALKRCSVYFNFIYLRTKSKLRLWQIQYKIAVTDGLSVIPDDSMSKRSLSGLQSNTVSNDGNHTFYRFSIGNEFKGLREYMIGDQLRDLDWKVSRRIGKLFTKVYQPESQVPLTVLLDCGRLMSVEENGILLFERAIGSLIELAKEAINARDQVRVIAFADRIIGDLSIDGRASSLARLYAFLAKLKPLHVHSHYSLAFEYAVLKVKKHGLLLCISDIQNKETALRLGQIANPLTRHFKVVIILMRDPELARRILLTQNEIDEHDLWTRVAALEMSEERDQAIRNLQAAGIKTIDTSQSVLAQELIKQYSAWKRGNRS